MRIVSQNGALINFEVVHVTRKIDCEIRCYFTSKNYVIAGRYKTEERAREVLQEIINKYLEYASIQDGLGNKKQICEMPKVYYMPED